MRKLTNDRYRKIARRLNKAGMSIVAVVPGPFDTTLYFWAGDKGEVIVEVGPNNYALPYVPTPDLATDQSAAAWRGAPVPYVAA